MFEKAQLVQQGLPEHWVHMQHRDATVPSTDIHSTQTSTTPVPGDLTPLLVSVETAYLRCTYTQQGIHT